MPVPVGFPIGARFPFPPAPDARGARAAKGRDGPQTPATRAICPPDAARKAAACAGARRLAAGMRFAPVSPVFRPYGPFCPWRPHGHRGGRFSPAKRLSAALWQGGAA